MLLRVRSVAGTPRLLAGKPATKRLPGDAVEFLRRFVQQMLSWGFVKMRHDGLLAHGQRTARLNVGRRLLLVATVPSAATLTIEPAQPRCCPECGGTRLVCRERRCRRRATRR